MNEIVRTPEIIAGEIRNLTGTMLLNIVEIGRRMKEAKELLPHGEFAGWLQNNTGYSQRTANNFMKLFEEYGDRQGSLFGAQLNSQTFANLPYTKALALISIPESSREAFAEEVKADKISLKQLQEEVKHWREKAEEAEGAIESAEKNAEELTKAAQKEATDARRRAAKAEQELQELKDRPVEVVTREPSDEEKAEYAQEAVNKAASEMQERHNKELKKQKELLDKAANEKAKAEDRLKELEEAAKAADEDKRRAVEEAKEQQAKELKKAVEAAKELQETIRSMEKKAALSDAAVVRFKVFFEEWQSAYISMLQALDDAPEEARIKLKAAMEAQMKAWS